MINALPPNDLPLSELVDIDNDTYHSTAGVSSSALKEAKRSQLAYWQKYVNPERVRSKPTRAMVSGSFFHTMTSEGDKLPDEYIIKPRSFNAKTKEGKAAKEAFERYAGDRIQVSQLDYDNVRRMRDAAYAHPILGKLLEAGQAEKSRYWHDDETDLLLKVRPDWLPAGADNVVIDLKSCRSAESSDFGRDAANLEYPMSAAHYIDGLPWCDAFIFAAVEKEPPYHVALYVMERDSHDYDTAKLRNRRAIRAIAEGYRTGVWLGEDPMIRPLELPKYYY